MRDLIVGTVLSRPAERGLVWNADQHDVRHAFKTVKRSHGQGGVIGLDDLLGKWKVLTDEDVNVLGRFVGVADLRELHALMLN